MKNKLSNRPPRVIPGQPKPRRKSKTYQFNALMAGLLALESNMAMLKPLLGEQTYIVFAVVVLVGNAILREFTTQPVKGL